MGIIEVNMPSQSVYLLKYWRYNTSTSTWELNSTKNDDAANITYASGATDFTSSTWKPWANTTSSCYLIGKPEAGVLPISANRGTSNSYYSWDVTNMSVTSAGVLSSTTLTPASVYLKQAWEFSYIGEGQSFIIPATGTYTIECWGGGDANGGAAGGGYVSGDIELEEDMMLYIYVGQTLQVSTSYSFNGGGPSVSHSGVTGYTGSGATDVRTTMHSEANGWGGTISMRSRIIVAGGSGKATGGITSNSASAGGLIGYQGRQSGYDSYCGRGGGQTSGGAVPSKYFDAISNGTAGSFGYGGSGGISQNAAGGCGGGGGWYGGSGASGASSGCFAGSGGSSFISGHPYCNGINSSGTHQGAGNPSKVLYQGTGSEHTVTFTNTLMIDGGGYKWTGATQGELQQMPNPDGGYYSSGVGHSGNGYCRITK